MYYCPLDEAWKNNSIKSYSKSDINNVEKSISDTQSYTKDTQSYTKDTRSFPKDISYKKSLDNPKNIDNCNYHIKHVLTCKTCYSLLHNKFDGQKKFIKIEYIIIFLIFIVVFLLLNND